MVNIYCKTKYNTTLNRNTPPPLPAVTLQINMNVETTTIVVYLRIHVSRVQSSATQVYITANTTMFNDRREEFKLCKRIQR